MFRAARIYRAVSPFSIFLMDQKNNPDLRGYSIGKRAKVLSRMYKELPQSQRKDLRKRAEKHPSMNKKTQKKKPTKNEFSRFVKENYDKVMGLNYKRRFSALSQLYELQKPIELSKELRKIGVDPATVNIGALVKPAVVTVPKVVTGRAAVKVKPAKAKAKVKRVSKASKKAVASSDEDAVAATPHVLDSATPKSRKSRKGKTSAP